MHCRQAEEGSVFYPASRKALSFSLYLDSFLKPRVRESG